MQKVYASSFDIMVVVDATDHYEFLFKECNTLINIKYRAKSKPYHKVSTSASMFTMFGVRTSVILRDTLIAAEYLVECIIRISNQL